MLRFCHLHCHTQYSLLDGAAHVGKLIGQAKILGMDALAITDHGNMFGVPHFVAEAKKQGIKPIIGCEFYVAANLHSRTDKRRYHQLLLARDEEGYQNLIKLCSIGYTEGYYYKPRIDRKHIEKYRHGLIATTCCLGAEVPQAIIHQGEKAAEKIFIAWLSIFGLANYYIELQRHGLPEQDKCNEVLRDWSRRYGVKMIATNDVHYIKQEDSKAHDILLCLQTGADFDDSKRMRFANDQFFLKSPSEMADLFADVPEAITNTVELANEIADPVLERDLLLPIFDLPEGFTTQYDYLKFLTLEGAKKLQTGLDSFKERIDHELGIIDKMGYAGYFLIVKDLVDAAKKLGIMVGPGRGSVAGSLVAYCLGITTINPLAYQLIFERFLNPDRISMPDIDLDFDDERREHLISYLVKKYGSHQVAQIITFGTMGVKTAIRDVARVLKLPLQQANYLAKLVPDQPSITFKQAFEESPELFDFYKKKDSEEGQVLTFASTLEGCTRHTGIHAAGVIIAPGQLTNYIPVKKDKKSDLLVTQYEGSFVEQAGMLKMDILGLKTLSIIRDTLDWVKKNHGVSLAIDNLPLNDKKTFSLFQQGDTIAVFQFESEGMRKWLKKLLPNHIEDLIAMNALYRPGPMQFIPNFIDRKHGKEKINYPHPSLVDILKPTYGIMVYQEQIMQTAQIIANYTLAQADVLRYAMGKKKVKEMDEQRSVFITNAEKKGLSKEKAIEIFAMMEKFSRYGFNRSHSVAYALIAYQTAYLKANYPTEFMAAVLTHNQDNIEKVSFFIQECKRMGITIQGPNINTSGLYFSPSEKNTLHFGLAAIKDVGQGAVEFIIQERSQHGDFQDIYDFTKRMVDKKINKKMLERLAMVGAFDVFKPFLHRRQYLFAPDNDLNLIARSLQIAKKDHDRQTSKQLSLFAAEPLIAYGMKPKAPDCEPYTQLEKLHIEKEFIGFYLSGHPLDDFQIVMQTFCNAHTQNVFNLQGKEVGLAGIIVDYKKKQNKSGGYYATFTLEDKLGKVSLQLFGEKFKNYEKLLQEGILIYLVAKVQLRYGQKDTWQLAIKHIEDLRLITQKYVKTLIIRLPHDKLSKDLAKNLHQAIKQHPGSCQLQIHFSDEEKEISIHTLSHSYQVNPSIDFFNHLTNLKLSYCLVK